MGRGLGPVRYGSASSSAETTSSRSGRLRPFEVGLPSSTSATPVAAEPRPAAAAARSPGDRSRTSSRSVGSHRRRQAQWNHAPERFLRCARPTTLPSGDRHLTRADAAEADEGRPPGAGAWPRALDVGAPDPEPVQRTGPGGSEPRECAGHVRAPQRVVRGDPHVDPHRVVRSDEHRSPARTAADDVESGGPGGHGVDDGRSLGRAQDDRPARRSADGHTATRRVPLHRRPGGVECGRGLASVRRSPMLPAPGQSCTGPAQGVRPGTRPW